MAYSKTTWTDRNVQNPRTYTMTDNGDSTYTFTPAPGTVYEAGTPVNASNMNKIESELETLDTRTYALDSAYITSILPMSKGGTGKSTRAEAIDSLASLGAMPISSTSDDTTANWRDLRSGVAWYSSSGKIADQPSAYGYLLNVNSSSGVNDVHQLWFAQSDGSVFHRGGNANGWGANSWHTLLDSVNFGSFVTPATIGAAASSHNHSASNITSGSLTIARGGTGSSNAADARTALGITPSNIGAASSSHTHSASDVTSGTLQISRGGTGSSNAADARTALGITLANLGAASASHTHALTDLSGTLSVAKGGTGATTASAALSALGAAAASHTHAIGDTTGTLAVSKGGTGATSAANARSNLGITLANLGAASASHTHAYGDLTGTLAVSRGGTGATTAANARTNLGITLANLGAAASGHGHALTDSVITGTLPIGKGGTGATGAYSARTNLGVDGTHWNGCLLGSFSTSASTGIIELPQSGTWLIITGHNSTANLNSVFLVRCSANAAFGLVSAGTYSGSMSGTQCGAVAIKVTGTTLEGYTASGWVNVYGIYLG